jgi:hypothetical protein
MHKLRESPHSCECDLPLLNVRFRVRSTSTLCIPASAAFSAHAYTHHQSRAAGDDASLCDFTPSFLWLLRDFYLKLEEDGRKVGLWIDSGCVGAAVSGVERGGPRGGGIV